MVTHCPTDLDAPGEASPAAMDSGMRQAFAWLTEADVFAQAVRMGEMVPDFTLPDWQGGMVELQQLLDRGPLVLFFFSCFGRADVFRTLQKVQEALPAIEATGAHVTALSAVAPATMRAAAEALQLAFPIAHDADCHVAHLFGLTYEPPEANDQWSRRIGVPTGTVPPDQPFVLPATYVIKGDGIAEYAVLEADLRHRVRVADLLRVLASLNSRR